MLIIRMLGIFSNVKYYSSLSHFTSTKVMNNTCGRMYVRTYMFITTTLPSINFYS